MAVSCLGSLDEMCSQLVTEEVTVAGRYSITPMPLPV